jgi:hypothetical protein
MPYIPSIISGSLPVPTGPYAVGYYTLTHAPLPGQGFVLSSPTIDTTSPANAKAFGSPSSTPNNASWKEGHVPALGLRRVEYSVWYPCQPAKGWFGRDAAPSGVGWLPTYVAFSCLCLFADQVFYRPVQDVLEGYARFANDSPWLRAAYPLLRVLGGRISVSSLSSSAVTPFNTPPRSRSTRPPIS